MYYFAAYNNLLERRFIMELLTVLLTIALGTILIAIIVMLPFYIIYWLIKNGVEAGNKKLIEANEKNTERIIQEIRRQKIDK
jgi:ABC-type bacteriocin/lantibiotic exporter with double-glycine peptidase domain